MVFTLYLFLMDLRGAVPKKMSAKALSPAPLSYALTLDAPLFYLNERKTHNAMNKASRDMEYPKIIQTGVYT